MTKVEAQLLLLSVTLLLSASVLGSSSEASEKETAWAVAYEIVPHECERPKVKKTGYSPGSQRNRFERRVKRYQKCLQTYLAGLLEDHGKLLEITKGQTSKQNVALMVTKLKSIQETVETVAPQMDMSNEINEYETQARMNLRATGVTDEP